MCDPSVGDQNESLRISKASFPLWALNYESMSQKLPRIMVLNSWNVNKKKKETYTKRAEKGMRKR